jgi:hypothetical protein
MRILLSLAFEPKSLKPIEDSIERFKDKNPEVYFLFVLDPEVGRSIMDKVLENGFVGERTAIQLNQAIMKDYRERGYYLLEEVKKIVKRNNLPYEGLILEGDLIMECKAVINSFNIDYAIIFIKKKKKSIYKIDIDKSKIEIMEVE